MDGEGYRFGVKYGGLRFCECVVCLTVLGTLFMCSKGEVFSFFSCRLPYVTMGSGSLAAMSIFEAGWQPDLSVWFSFSFSFLRIRF